MRWHYVSLWSHRNSIKINYLRVSECTFFLTSLFLRFWWFIKIACINYFVFSLFEPQFSRIYRVEFSISFILHPFHPFKITDTWKPRHQKCTSLKMLKNAPVKIDPVTNKISWLSVQTGNVRNLDLSTCFPYRIIHFRVSVVWEKIRHWSKTHKNMHEYWIKLITIVSLPLKTSRVGFFVGLNGYSFGTCHQYF